MAGALCINAQTKKIPADPAFRIGKLDNGLTYYIRHNNYPEHLANFYIAQRVGSIQEEDHQRGLAHFLEHMAFNGSEHFEGSGIIDYCRTLGIAFGSDINAYTSIERTVYNIDNVPTARQSALDSCLLILRDWSNGLTLKGEEIDKERGVIHGEWAMRNSASQRLSERNLPKMFPGNRYGMRMPIGTMEIVDNFEYDALRQYYRKWYHPENQAIIVIGDVDVDHTEAMIKKMFGDIKAGPEAAHIVPITVEDNEEPIYILDTDKENTGTSFSIMMKREVMPMELRGTEYEVREAFKWSMARSMLSRRVSEMVQKPDCQFQGLSVGYGNFMVTSTKNAAKFNISLKENKFKEGIEAGFQFINSVLRDGFTQAELDRAKTSMNVGEDNAYARRDKRSNTDFYNMCLANYISGSAITDIDTDYKICKRLISEITLDEVNAIFRDRMRVNQDRNMLCVVYGQDKEGIKYPTVDGLRDIVNAARTKVGEKWVEETVDRPLVAKMPKAGKIKKEADAAFGFKELTLSNGIKVYMKKTNFSPNSISLNGWSDGGSALYGDEEIASLKMLGTALGSSCIGGFTKTQLSKLLNGKSANAGVGLSGRSKTASGSCTPKDMETMFQLLYKHFTDITPDTAAWSTSLRNLRQQLKNRDLDPNTAFNDTVSAITSKNNVRSKPLTLADVNSVDYMHCLDLVKRQFTTAKGFTFTIIGDYDEAALKDMLCKYVASLPTKGKVEKAPNRSTTFDGEIVCNFTRKMQTPKPMVMNYYYCYTDNTLENSILSSVAASVMRMILLKTVREDAGATYSVGASCGINYEPEHTRASLSSQAPISDPSKVALAKQLMDEAVANFGKPSDTSGVDFVDAVNKTKANMLKNYEVSLKNNSQWVGALTTLLRQGVDKFTDYKSTLEAVTPEMVRAHVEKIVAAGNHVHVTMMPE